MRVYKSDEKNDKTAPFSNGKGVFSCISKKAGRFRKKGAKRAIALFACLISLCVLFTGCQKKEDPVNVAKNMADLLKAPFAASCTVQYADTTAQVSITQSDTGFLKMEATAPKSLEGFMVYTDEKGVHMAFRDVEIQLETLPDGMVNAYTLFLSLIDQMKQDTLPAVDVDETTGEQRMALSDEPSVILYANGEGIPVRMECKTYKDTLLVTVDTFEKTKTAQ